MTIQSIKTNIQSAYAKTVDFVSEHKQAVIGGALALISVGAYIKKDAIAKQGASLLNRASTGLSNIATQGKVLLASVSIFGFARAAISSDETTKKALADLALLSKATLAEINTVSETGLNNSDAELKAVLAELAKYESLYFDVELPEKSLPVTEILSNADPIVAASVNPDAPLINQTASSPVELSIINHKKEPVQVSVSQNTVPDGVNEIKITIN